MRETRVRLTPMGLRMNSYPDGWHLSVGTGQLSPPEKSNNLFISIRHPASNTRLHGSRRPRRPSLLQAGNLGGLPDYSLNK